MNQAREIQNDSIAMRIEKFAQQFAVRAHLFDARRATLSPF